MVRHSRLQKKNRKKLKSVDPFNKKNNVIREKLEEKRNLTPKKEDFDDQEMPKSLLEIQQAQERMEIKGSFPKKRNITSIQRQAERMGFKKKRYETDDDLIRRMNNKTFEEFTDELIKAKIGTAGRDKSEIDRDYAELDALEAKQKAEKKRLKEKERIKKGGKKKDEKDVQCGETKEDEEKEKKTQMSKAERLKMIKEQQKEDIRQQRFNEQAAEEREFAMLNREVVKFGERYDAPPSFVLDKKTKQKIGQCMSKAGGKNLLLKGLLGKREEKSTTFGELDEKKTALQEMERQRVIEAYRNMKRNKITKYTQQEDSE